ncbi:MAG: hypothetical protein Q7R95_10680 [bacterium]|nr:hypothetical protein [bacterium]
MAYLRKDFFLIPYAKAIGFSEKRKFYEKYWSSFPEIDIYDIFGKNDKRSYEEKYGETNKLEKTIDDLDKKYLTMIIELRQSLWT